MSVDKFTASKAADYYFVFIDESGVLTRDENQPTFSVGMWFVLDTARVYNRLIRLKDQAVGRLSGNPKLFEFKFYFIKKSNIDYYKELIDIALSNSSHQFCTFVINKLRMQGDPSSRFDSTWSAYLRYSEIALARSCKQLKPVDRVVVVADHVPQSDAAEPLEYRLNRIEHVVNSMMIESDDSLFIQVIDVIAGCVSYAFRQQQCGATDAAKLEVMSYLATRLGISSLAGDLIVTDPCYFRIWEFQPSDVRK